MIKILLKINLIVFIALFLANCSNDKINGSIPEKNGQVSIKFDKSLIPQEIISISAIMTRNGYNAIIKTLNVTLNASAEILIEDIVPGTWHLKINASNDNGVILYSAETDTEILSNIVTKVTLILKPVGKLQINVAWENNTKLMDYPGNPILTKFNNSTPYGPYFGRVLIDEGKFKMWYANSFGSDKYDVGYAESLDGYSWNIVNSSVLKPGTPNSWDSYSVHPGAVIKEGNTFKMYYTGYSAPNDPRNKRVGLAISYDGITWFKSGEEVTNKINIIGITTDIIKINGTYFLYYGNNEIISLATSSDGYTWYNMNRDILTASEPWEGSRIWSFTVISDENKLKMLYMCGQMNAFGYAESVDGITWYKKPTPIFTYNQTDRMWPYDIRYPYLRKFGQTYYIYYSTISLYHECKMGVATALTLK